MFTETITTMLDPDLLSDDLCAFFSNPEDLERAHEAVDLIIDSAEADKSAMLSIIPLMIVAARGLTFDTEQKCRTDDEHAQLVFALSEEALCDYVGRISMRAGKSTNIQNVAYRDFIFCIHFVSKVLMTHTARLLKTTRNISPDMGGARA